MGLLDKVFNKKSDEKTKREVKDGFDKNEANEIFDILDKQDTKEAKKLSKNMQKEVDLTKEVSNLLKQAKKTNSIELYEKVLVIQPENAEAYEGLANIYKNNNDTDNEIKVLKLAVQKIDGNNKIKNKLMQRLKEIN
ncbi:tetratricopeptide repeat protein [Methanobrevibacter sp.]|uniref:tetratricopeptide repeat protein n=1 Tax=Methanobrevibacter sp. TaxID=66852 RepID=UPI0025FAF9C2|nr:tetratricopeptide repeat protein [Methanobrevibacter sp.]MBQ6512395.1 tetratricopeptide repeat protein [Methanobrevibacter sp.]